MNPAFLALVWVGEIGGSVTGGVLLRYRRNNDGGGFADTIEVAEGISITQLFEQRLPHGKLPHSDVAGRLDGAALSDDPFDIFFETFDLERNYNFDARPL